MKSIKFGTNLGGRAFFFFGFTHRPIIETANSFVLNTLLENVAALLSVSRLYTNVARLCFSNYYI